MAKSKTRCIGILTSGGDCPGLNAAIRAVAKAAINEYGMRVVGFLDGFRGLVENRFMPLDDRIVSGILTQGGTILGTSRDKPHKMPMGGKVRNMIATAVENARNNQIDCLVCLGGGGTQKNAYRLHTEGGMNVLTLPKTIDNDVVQTDISFGFDTARSIATEAIDRLHTTATSHHRIIVCEIMGHNAGWLPLAAGIAGGADVILIPEIPYDLEVIGEYLLERRRHGKRFSIVAVAEGAISKEEAATARKGDGKADNSKGKNKSKKSGGFEGVEVVTASNMLEQLYDETRAGMPVVVSKVEGQMQTYHIVQEPVASKVARLLQQLTGSDARVTTLGHIQRGGIPTAADRMLCTQLGTKAARLLAEGVYNVMVAMRSGVTEPVALDKVAGRRKVVQPDGPLIESARLVGTCLGDN